MGSGENEFKDFRSKVLIIFIGISILFCLYYSSVFLLMGATMPAVLQTGGTLFMGLSLILIFKNHSEPAKYLSVTTSYLLILAQNYIYFGPASGFQFQYLALLVVAFTIFRSEERKTQYGLFAFTLLLIATFLFLENFSLLRLASLIPHGIRDAFFYSSIIGTFAGLFIVLFFFSKELGRNKMELQHMASIDLLTSLNNRRSFIRYSEAVFENAVKNGDAFSLVMIDIDRFKPINDIYGHKAGDIAIKQVAQIIKNSIREKDYCARYGGEEFALILPQTNENKALVVADKIRVAVEKNFFDIGNMNPVHLTVSIGISSYKKDDKSIDSLLSKADIALYWSKGNGRNRCSTHFEAL